MKVLVACEFSGTVRDAFIEKGHDAISVDLLPTERPGPHYQGDIFDFLEKNPEWDLMIAHPPCTHLAGSGARWFKDKVKEQQEALDFVKRLLDVDIPKICLENPVGMISTKIKKPNQIVHPYHFGEEATKRTCLWLKNLPELIPTNIVGKGEFHITSGGIAIQKWYNLPDTKARQKIRSKTFQGMADAMADQWG